MTEIRRYRSVMADNARWEGFEFRPGDIVISTSPKCGTTWMQMMCALLIFQDPKLPRKLTELSPWVEILTEKKEEVFALLAAQEHRRFIKSHTPLDGIPWDERVTYITVGRDPRDVAVSWGNHFANMDLGHVMEARAAAVGLEDLAEVMGSAALPPSEPEAQFWHWIGDETPVETGVTSLMATVHHLATFWEKRDRPNVALFHYADLKADLRGEMGRLADLLGISVPEALWPALVDAACFEQMRSRAADLAPEMDVEGFWKDPDRFFNRGETGQWRQFMDSEGEARYLERLALLAHPDLAEWVQRGWRSEPAPV